MKRVTVLICALVLCVGALGWSATRYREAPMLADLVAKGQLPPVDQRLPDEPPVLTPVDGIGQYGGTLHLFATSNLPWEDLGEIPERGTYMLKVDAKGGIAPDLARDYKLAPDNKSLTLYLRKGVKWSDGVPFTADDIVFMYQDLHWNTVGMQTWNLMPEIKRVIKVDDYTVRFEMDQPYPVILIKLTGPGGGDWFLFQPKHYLQKWHIKYNPDADKLAQSEGFKSWSEALYYHYWWSPLKDLDKPTLQPWILKQFSTTTKVSVRNPYYWKVDTAGNQLPYVDRLEAQIIDAETYNLKIISGEADVAFVHTSFDNYTLFKENEAKGGYKVVSMPGLNGSDVALSINVNYPDPVLRPIYANVKFRQALSVAIDRDDINKSVYLGQATPRQATVLPSVRYYDPKWGTAFAQFDPRMANSLLDEVGLSKRDKDGFRIGPDGKTFVLTIELNTGGEGATGVGKVIELVKEHWQAVGLKTEIKPEEASLIDQRRATNNHEILVLAMDASDEFRNYESGAEYWAGGGSDFSWANLWGQWLAADRDIKLGRKKLSDYAGGKMPGEEPPAAHKQLQQWVQDRNAQPFGSPTYMDLSKKIFTYHAQQLFMIGTVGMAPALYVAKNNIGNVPKAYKPAMTWPGDLNYYSDQLYIKQ